MRTVCAWCGCHLLGDPAAARVSHGICEACVVVFEADARPVQREEPDEASPGRSGA